MIQLNLSNTLTDTEQKLKKYLEAIFQDYVNSSDMTNPIREEMYQSFVDKSYIVEGSSYYKVVVNNSAHSFVVKKDGKGFKAGDVLKAASWSAPSKNFARVNINDGNYMNIRWSGC